MTPEELRRTCDLFNRHIASAYDVYVAAKSAADTIERLQRENAELKRVLEQVKAKHGDVLSLGTKVAIDAALKP